MSGATVISHIKYLTIRHFHFANPFIINYFIYLLEIDKLMKQILQNLIAEGKTAQAITLLRQATQHDSDEHNSVIHLSARLAEYNKQKHSGIADSNTLSIELNKIHIAILAIVNKLPDENQVDTVTPSVSEGKTIIQNADKIYNIQHIDNANFS